MTLFTQNINKTNKQTNDICAGGKESLLIAPAAASWRGEENFFPAIFFSFPICSHFYPLSDRKKGEEGGGDRSRVEDEQVREGKEVRNRRKQKKKGSA
jgi:hypothetical protein